MRRNRELATGFGKDFGAFLELAVTQTSSMAKSHFRACHIHIGDEEFEEEYSSDEDWS